MRGLARTGVIDLGQGGVHVLLEHSNRGKRSMGLDLAERRRARGRSTGWPPVSDVFLTNKLPRVRRKLQHRRRRHPRPQPEHRLRARHRLRTARPRRGRAAATTLWVLVALRRRRRSIPPGPRPVHLQPAPGLRRLDRRHDDRRRHLGGPAPPRAHRRGRRGRRLLAGHGMWAIGAGIALAMQTGHAWQQSAAQQSRRSTRSSLLPHQGRALDLSVVPAGLSLLARRLPGARYRRAHRRPAIRRPTKT